MAFTLLLVFSELLLFVWSIALTWALDGPEATFFSASTKKSDTGTPLCGSSFFSSWALDGGLATFLSPSTKKSETGTPLYGSSFSYFSSWALDGPEATFFSASTKKSETGTPLYGSSFFSTNAYLLVESLAFAVNESFFLSSLLPVIPFKPSITASDTGFPLYGGGSSFLFLV